MITDMGGLQSWNPAAAMPVGADIIRPSNGAPRRPNGVVVVGRGGTVEGTSFAACGEASDP